MNALLRVENLRAGYGLIEVLKGISFEVHEGEIVALLGADGAAPAAPARRAVARPGPAHHAADLRGHRPAQPRGHGRPARGTERPPRPAAGPPRLRPGNREHHAERPGPSVAA